MQPLAPLPSKFADPRSLSGALIALAVLAVLVRVITLALRPQLKFIWHAFFAPIGKKSRQKDRLDTFYEGQAEYYDATRKGLLRGRKTMLNLSAAHLGQLRENSPTKRLIWVDIGAGTGHNVEAMEQFMPISSFDAIYLIDLCEPLLEVARKRIAKRGWKNVYVLCQDASTFTLPEWTAGVDPKGSVGFVTLSYSLSMIPNFYMLLDRIDYVLAPEEGLLAAVDFYTSGHQPAPLEKAIGGQSKECGWLSRWFWQIWFDFDHVSLGPQRREYLEYKFGTVKSYNGRNRFALPLIVRIPYYIWLGRSRACDSNRISFTPEFESSPTSSNLSKLSTESNNSKDDLSLVSESSTETLAQTEHVIDITPPLSSFQYQTSKVVRMPYYEQPIHREFKTFIYSFTWEDPFEDMKILNLSSDDSMLVITSAGDNALHYAIEAKPKRIHCVDLNPCQGHLLELKLAAIQALSYSEFFALFGEGKHPNFCRVLDAKLSPRLSSACYQFWRINVKMFSSQFYLQGYSGFALRIAQRLFQIAGVTRDVQRLCSATTIAEQEKIWREKLRPVLLNPLVVALLNTPAFCWNALGVPSHQRQMLLNEGNTYDYIKDTLDPIPSTSLLRSGAYHYLLTLLGHYTPDSCPLYLTQAGYDKLRSNDHEALDAFRLHTDTVLNVLHGLKTSSLTRAVIMDHLDWFTYDSPELHNEIAELHRVIAPGGFVLLRSAAKNPGYMETFARAGFKTDCLGVRTGNKVAIDQVNMYASFWRAERLL